MIWLCELFDVSYGHSLELNRLQRITDGINFISRTARNNGVSAQVISLAEVEPMAAGKLTVALGGPVLETFVQPKPFYTGFHIFCLTPLFEMATSQKLHYCACIRANKYRYNYGRQANRTLKDILKPAPEELPNWVNDANPDCFEDSDKPKVNATTPELFESGKSWHSFTFNELFELKKGKRLTKANMTPGNVPFIGAIDSNNGLTAFVGQEALHPENTITVNYNGNGVAEAFYQPVPYRCTDDVNVLYPRFKITPAIALFIATAIRQEKYRFSYGRKWHLKRMKNSTIGLPVDEKGDPDWVFMENYINTIPFSSQL